MTGLRAGGSRIVLQIIRVGRMGFLAFSLSPALPAQSLPTTPRSEQAQAEAPPKPVPADADQTFTLVGAGDIATCKHLDSAEAHRQAHSADSRHSICRVGPGLRKGQPDGVQELL